MSKIDFSNSQLNVHFSLNELYQISSALASESFVERDKGRHTNSDISWKLRLKVIMFIDLYKNSLVW